MQYNILVSNRARQQLGQHIAFLAQVDKSAARKKQKQILDALHSLSEMPQRYPFLESAYFRPNQYHKMCIEKWHIVLYQIKDNTVEVDYILDCRKDYQWLL